MYNFSNIKLVAVSSLLFCLSFIINDLPAQNVINMPYSIYGIGEIRFNHYYRNLGMGGINQAYRTNMAINDVNPASYTAIDTTSFVFDATMITHFYGQKTNSISQFSDYVSLGNISMGFPITRWWAFGAGIKPYSLMGYSIRDKDTLDLAGGINYLYEGSGGLTQLFLGTAIEPVSGLSLGMNASYVFGKINREASVFSDSAGVYITNRLLTDQVNGWMIGFGAQYQYVLSDNRYVTLGATFGQKNDMDSRSSEILRRRMPGAFQFDTIAYKELGEEFINLPRYFGAGIFAKINQNWAAGFDFQTQNWASFKTNRNNNLFNNSYQMATGLRFSPTVETFSPFFHRMRYSAGFRYGQSYINYNNQALDEFGISFGVYVPVRRVNSGINLGFEYSSRGSLDRHYMQESFYRLNIGINIYERWFIRRRFY